ncbi:major capsid protein [Phenylobacterium sp. VNQ135]|uniref:major capsid protein n=1 Tax=Phenylobacterium sp. VNQ135 TaxID=3400922 RepID=UPI003C115C94
MAATVLSDVIVPEVFNPYVIERTAELSAFWQSGIVGQVDGLTLGDGGQKVQMPFWQDLAGEDQILTTGANLTVGNITADKDVAVLNARALVYGAKDLVGALAGDDPMDAIATLVADKWTRRFQTCLINTVNGAMGALAAESPAVNTLNISGLSGAAAVFDGEAFIDALGQLGDAETRLSAVAVHSATYRLMKKQGLIEFIREFDGAEQIPTYMGKRVIVDDGMPVSSGTYTTYLFGEGAIGYAEGQPKVPVETERNALTGGGEEYLVSRRHFILHPRGIKWDGTPAANTPTNAELATVGNWERVYEAKNVRIVRFVHKLA